MDDNSIYTKMTAKSRKRAINSDRLKFKPLDEIKSTLAADVFNAIGKRTFINVEVDPDNLNHHVAARFSCTVDRADAQRTREVFAQAFDALVYAVSDVPDYYDSNKHNIIYDIKSDNYLYKPVLGRDY